MSQKVTSGLLQKTKVPLFGAYSNRSPDPDKDQRFINVFPESRKIEQLDQMRVNLVKRPGSKFHKYYDLVTLEEDPWYLEARGIAYFNGYLYTVWGNKLFVDIDPEGVTAPIEVLELYSSTRKVGFVKGNSAVLGDYLFFTDGDTGYYIDDAYTITEITGLPYPHTTTPVFLDGYIFIAYGSDIYNCDLDDPATWNSSNFISAESFSDPIRALARQNNQIVAFGSTSTEFFYDAANASGSPLNRNESALIQIGCFAPDCIYQGEKYCFFIGQSESGGKAIWMIEGFQPKKISDEFIERILDAERDIDSITYISTIKGYGFRTMGHFFYLMNFKGLERTFLYDVDEKLWHEWGTAIPVPDDTESLDLHATYYIYSYATDTETNTIYFQNDYSPCVCYLDPTYHSDDYYVRSPTHKSIQIPLGMFIRTNKYDMDTINRKRLHSLRLISDSTELSETSFIEVRYTDDDYYTYSSAREIVLDNDFPILYQLGIFRRRAFEIRGVTNHAMRFEALELLYTEGIS
jgi:hypothetical protein